MEVCYGHAKYVMGYVLEPGRGGMLWDMLSPFEVCRCIRSNKIYDF